MKLRYPIGIQSFEKLRKNGFAYVDKTRFVEQLADEGQYIFLSRPRRFGKSLLLSTLEAFFEGKRELFEGLAIDTPETDWTPYPVLHFDFNPENFRDENGLERLLDSQLRAFEASYGRDPADLTPAQRFNSLIRNAYNQTERQVVILVDEYDKPLLGLEDWPELFEKNQAILKGFFGNLKSMDRYVRFGMITGVARFNKVSIFSDLNNLRDVSLSDKYADICGLTEDELVETFRSGIEGLATKRKESFDDTLTLLRRYYDGYLFAEEGSRMYNPFSVLSALQEERVEPYWFGTGTPTFLAKRIRKFGIDPSKLNGQKRTYSELIQVGIGTENPVPLMFQTGYLTIDSYDYRTQRYTLRFPNREVEIGFASNLLPLYVPGSQDVGSEFGITLFQDDLLEGEPNEFMKRLETLFKTIPGEDHRESTYRAITYLVCLLSGIDACAERRSYKGRSDLEVQTYDYVYIFEFKYNETVEAAMAQIKERDYAGRFAMESRRVYLIGANYDPRKSSRGLTYQIEEYRK